MPISKKLLEEIGIKAADFIRENALEKLDYAGEPFAPYSFGYWMQKKYKKKSRAKKGSKARAKFRAAALAAWQGDKNNVNLTDTFNMLSSLTVTKTDEATGEAQIGFTNKEAAEIAYYHNVSGAGKGRVLRKFMGLQPKQEDELRNYVESKIGDDKVFLRGLLKDVEDALAGS